MQGREPLAVPGALVAGHAPFCWGKTAADAAHTAVILEELAAMAWNDHDHQSRRQTDLRSPAQQALLPQARPESHVRPISTDLPTPACGRAFLLTD
jgi:L-ribulose-5-phosphate 4-epimerase